MTQTEKILIYSLAVIVFEEKFNYNCLGRSGICVVLSDISGINSMVTDFYFSEFGGLKPHRHIPFWQYWFPRTDSGDKQRIKLLKKAIKEANKIP